MRTKYWLSLLFLLLNLSANSSSAESLLKPWLSQSWLRIYHYKKITFGGYKSDIQSDRFFFSSDGKKSPKKEYFAALDAFSNKKQWGVQKKSASCVFPARMQVLEDLSGEKFPQKKCKDLHNWIKRINADQVSLVFAGAYSGNPASVLGHTFLRFYSSSENTYIGQDLLSYSVGFMAFPNPQDSRVTYIVKGLTGGYPGFYEIEPHYMKVGLYNNSESRDLWEWQINVKPKQVRFLLHHLWELTFNARFNYYFIDENCSYRVLSFLDVALPHSSLTEQLESVVIPGETVRLAHNDSILKSTPRFQASIKRNIDFQIRHMSDTQKHQYVKAQKDLATISATDDPLVLDTLIDTWTYRNYKANTKLSPEQAKIMDNTLRKRAKVKRSSPIKVNSAEIKDQYLLKSILQGHKPSWVHINSSVDSNSEQYSLSYRTGYHPLWANSHAYDNIAQIEYLGLDINYRPKESTRKKNLIDWSLALIKTKSLVPITPENLNWSWSFEALAKNTCLICNFNEEKTQAVFSAGAGVTYASQFGTVFLLPMIQGRVWNEDHITGAIPAGLNIGYLLEFQSLKFTLETEQYWWKNNHTLRANLYSSVSISKNLSLIIQNAHSSINGKEVENKTLLGTAFFF